MDRRDELEFGGSGCLYALLTGWIPLAILAVVAGVLRLAGLPGDLLLYGALAIAAVWLFVLRERRKRPGAR